MTTGDLGINRLMRWALLAAVLTPIVSGTLIAVGYPFQDMGVRTLIGLWVEFEVLVLVAVAVLAGHARARSEKRRMSAIRQLRRRAVRDPLTSLLNRRGLVSVLSRQTWGGPQGGRSALLLDLDNFKRVNDVHGHIIGDRVLLAVADCLLDLAVEGWWAARLGGDEFLIVGRRLDHADLERQIASALDEALKRKGLPAVSVSFGRAFDPTGTEPLGDLVARADQDLGRRRGQPKGSRPDIGRVGFWVDDGSSGLLDLGRELARAGSIGSLNVPASARVLRRGALLCAGLALALSLLALAAVPLDLTWLRTVHRQGALSVTTFLALAIAAAALVCFFWGESTSPLRLRICRVGGWLIAAIGLATVLEHITGLTFLPSELISDPLENEVPFITRPDLESGIGLLCGGLYTVTIGRRGRLIEIFRTVVSLALIAVVAAAAFGILLGAGYLWQGNAPALSPHGMLTGTLLAVALLLAEPRHPLLTPFISGGEAARIANILVVAGIAVPLIGGTLLVQLDIAERAGWAPAVMAVALVQATILAALVVYSMRAAGRSDRETAELWRQLSEVADRDPLTGLFNRGRFNRELEISREILKRSGQPYSVILLDLDRLKWLNASRGYVEGDRALREVAAALETGVRPSDLPARLGGDEFGIVLPGAGEQEVAEIAKRCSARIEAAGDPELKVSWGAATAGATDVEPSALIAAADRRLYSAKRGDVEADLV